MNKKFTDPNADIQQFVKRFENEARDVYAKRQDITRAVGLKPGDAVADIGAGTGLFTFLFAEQVGPKGTVYAVDIGPVFMKYIAEQAKRRGQRGRQNCIEHPGLHGVACRGRSTLPSSATPTTTSSTPRRCWLRSTARCVQAGG